MLPPGRAWKVAAAVGGGLVVVASVAAFAVGPVVRARVAKEASLRHLEVEVGRVRPGFLTVRLEDVKVRPAGIPGLAVELTEVRADLTPALSLRELHAHGGRVALEGEPQDLLKRVDEYRHRAPSGGGGPAGPGRAPVSVDGLAVVWSTPSGAAISCEGVRIARGDEGVRVGAERITARRENVAFELKGLEVEVEPAGNLRRISASTLDVSVAPEPGSSAGAAPPPRAPSAEPAPPPLPPVTSRKVGKGKVQPAKAAVETRAGAPEDAIAPPEPLLPLPDLHGIRGRIALVAAEVERRVPDGLRVEVGGLSLHLDAAGEPIAFGPGPFSLERRGGAVHVVFTSGEREPRAPSGPGAPGTPLSVDLDLPLGPGDVVARLAGGPVSLAVLGVKEGMRGLADVARGTVSGKGKLALAADGGAVTFDGEVALRGIAWNQPRIAPEPMRDLSFQTSARGVLESNGKLRIDEAQLDMGALHLKAHGTMEDTREHFALSLGVDVAPAGCQALLESAPRGLMPTVQAMHMSGTFGASAQVAFDTQTIDKLLLDYRIDDGCRVLEVPREISRDRFAKAFTYRTYHPDGTPGETTTGPGTTAWTDLDAISPFMIAAVLTTEDGAFYKHHGFNHPAIRGSVLANLKARRFVRGASTISMQLAKNLFLSRSKVLSRKLEEVVLTDYLEQVFQKDELMELYLNAVEFGPDVYGITQAAEHYFARKPEELNLAECFFLATLLPSPVRFGKLREKGQVTEGWMKHLRTLMEIAAKNGKISRAELAEGLEETVTFVRPGEPRPTPRKPASAKRKDPFEDDAAWAPLD